MTGKELKAFAAEIHDDAEIEVREASNSYGRNEKEWNRDFEIQAPFIYKKKLAIEIK